MIILIILFILSILLNATLAIIAWRFANIVITIEDRLNEATDSINISEKVISEILKRPLFYDSPEVREVLNSIKRVQAAVIDVAYGLDLVEEDVNDKKDEIINNE